VLKAHCQTRLTCCLKNLKGCIPDSEKRRFHSIGLHKPIAVLNALMKTGYCVVDGICGDLSFEEGGTPVEANRVILGRDPMLIDSYCAELIGYHPDEIEHLAHAKRIGVGDYVTPDIKVVEINPQNKPLRKPGGERLADRYRGQIHEDAACSACYSALMYALHRSGRSRFSDKLCIGQGFKGKHGPGIGVGSCARGMSQCVPGCPPKATDIVELLRREG
jgi:hypothetical protein